MAVGVSTITVTAAQVAAAKVMVKRLVARGERPTDGLFAIANATKAPAPKKVSTNMIHARELDITAATTVSELFELVDLPHRITKHAKVAVIEGEFIGNRVLRIEWRGEPE